MDWFRFSGKDVFLMFLRIKTVKMSGNTDVF